MLKIAVLVGSSRPGRRSPQVAEWVVQTALQHPAVASGRASLDVVDIADAGLPLLAESAPAMLGAYEHDYTKAWAEVVASYDAFIFVTPEYNHSIPAVLKNAVDHLYAEWNDKAAAIVSFGVAGGTRAAEHLRQVLAEVKVATVRSQVTLSVFEDFVIEDPLEPGELRPRDLHAYGLAELMDDLLDWAVALDTVRAGRSSVAALATSG